MLVKAINIFHLIDEVAKNTRSVVKQELVFPSNDVLPPTAQNVHLIPPMVEALKPFKISFNIGMQKKKLVSVATMP